MLTIELRIKSFFQKFPKASQEGTKKSLLKVELRIYSNNSILYYLASSFAANIVPVKGCPSRPWGHNVQMALSKTGANENHL